MAINLIVPSSSPIIPLPAKRGVVITEPITLTADSAYGNVQITVSIPTKPTGSYVALMATDTIGNTYDIAAVGYWGPSGGFPVPLGYDATTNVSCVFSMVGDYVIRLTLNADGTSTDTDIYVHVTEGGASEKILVRRGLRANVMTATNVAAHELLYATDTRELFIANASGVPEKVIDVIAAASAPANKVSNLLWLNTTTNALNRWDTTLADWVGVTAAKVDWADVTNKPDPTITLSGDVSGSGTMVDVGSVTIDVTVADNSHNHIIDNVTGLQTALNGKSDVGHTHAISDVTGLQAELDNKSNVGHIHDDRYYTKTYTYTKAEVDAMLATIDGGTF